MGRTGNVTLKEIAEAAQVSVAAVSYVLNGKPGISDDRRRSIQRLLREAGLRPRHLQNPVFYLCNQRSLEDLSSFAPFFQKFSGINSALEEEQVDLRVEFIEPDDARGVQDRFTSLRQHKLGAVIVDSDLKGGVEVIAADCQKHGLPAVQLGHVAWSPKLDAVIVDDFGGAYAATQHLIAQGHRRIGTIRWNTEGDPASGRKHAGFLCAMQEAGVTAAPELIVASPFTRTGSRLTGRTAIEPLLRLAAPPTALFVENSFVSPSLLYPIDSTEAELPPGIRAIDAAHFEAWSLDFVEQVMTGVFNYPPRRTKLLRIDWAEMGRVAGKMIVDRLRGSRDNGGQTVRLAPKLMQAAGMTVTSI